MRPLMLVGTGSHVGKSLLAAGFCRLLRQDGFRPAPFKAQNMSLNSFVTPEGGELGRAQAAQAEAAGVECHVDMNPVLLKPTTDRTSQVIVHGRPVGVQSAREYFLGDRRELFEAALASFGRLRERFDPIVIEGAGSISELNLKYRDIANMRLARAVGASAYLVADIDRGGVFGSVHGSLALLEPEERACIDGVIVNRFRGDPHLFEEGVRLLEQVAGSPVMGVVPWIEDLALDEEDSVALEDRPRQARDGLVNVAVVRLRRLSNSTDFEPLARHPRVHLYYTRDPDEIARAQVVILPGSKNTVEDLLDLKRGGADAAVVRARREGRVVIGVCGGYQMLGRVVRDPLGVESRVPEVAGLGLLPVSTEMGVEKTTVRRTFRYRDRPEECSGYEIHAGSTVLEGPAEPVAVLDDGRPEGCRVDAGCWGTYLHGILDNPAVVEDLLAGLADGPGTAPPRVRRDRDYDRVADVLRRSLRLDEMIRRLRA